MFEIILAILKIVVKVVNPTELANMRKQKKLRELGTELFLLYIHINEILVCGESIVRALEECLSDKESEGKRKRITRQIVQQRMNLDRLARVLNPKGLQFQLQVLGLYNEIKRLNLEKAGALDGLLEVMKTGDIPLLGPTESDFRELAERGTEGMRDIYLRIVGSRVSVSSSWDEHTYKVVREYMESRKPYHQLDEIRALLEKMRNVLEKNFSIQDILLEIGDKRLNAYPYD